MRSLWHQALTVPVLEARLREECPQLSIEEQPKIVNASQSSMSAATQGPQMHQEMNHNSDGDKEMPL